MQPKGHSEHWQADDWKEGSNCWQQLSANKQLVEGQEAKFANLWDRPLD